MMTLGASIKMATQPVRLVRERSDFTEDRICAQPPDTTTFENWVQRVSITDWFDLICALSVLNNYWLINRLFRSPGGDLKEYDANTYSPDKFKSRDAVRDMVRRANSYILYNLKVIAKSILPADVRVVRPEDRQIVLDRFNSTYQFYNRVMSSKMYGSLYARASSRPDGQEYFHRIMALFRETALASRSENVNRETSKQIASLIEVERGQFQDALKILRAQLENILKPSGTQFPVCSSRSISQDDYATFYGNWVFVYDALSGEFDNLDPSSPPTPNMVLRYNTVMNEIVNVLAECSDQAADPDNFMQPIQG